MELSISEFGSPASPPLLLINSIGATKEVLWSRQIPALERHFRVITYDARGHGQSPVPPGEYTLDDLGRDAVSVLDATGVADAHVCGISMGGITAMWLGVHAAGRVRRLAVANTAARIGSLQSWGDRIALVRREGLAAVAEQAMPKWFTAPFREREPEIVRQFQSMVESISPEGYLGCCAALRDADLRDSIASIRRPTLAVAGAQDVLTPPDALAFVHQQVSGSTLLTLDCAHISNAEKADEFNDALVKFLAG
jgi:3-oxoadipate enol-lactonase